MTITHHCACDYHTGGVAEAAVKAQEEGLHLPWVLTKALAEVVTALTDTKPDFKDRNVKAMRIARAALEAVVTEEERVDAQILGDLDAQREGLLKMLGELGMPVPVEEASTKLEKARKLVGEDRAKHHFTCAYVENPEKPCNCKEKK